MKTLTERQPHAELIRQGVQTIVTRPKPTDHRGPVAIHAASRWEKGWRGVWVDPWSERPADAEKVRRYDLMVETLGCYPIEDANGSYYWTTDCRHLPLGAVVATATLTDVVLIWAQTHVPLDSLIPAVERYDDATNQLVLWDGDTPIDISDQLPFGDFTPGRYAWLLDDVEPVDPPVPARGRQGLWHWGEVAA